MSRIEEALRKAKAGHKVNMQRAAIAESQVEGNSGQTATNGQRKTAASQILTSHVVPVDNEQLLEQRVIAASEHDERVGPYRQLRTQLLKTMRDKQWTTLAITSANEGAGKTLTAANLAISLSRDVNTTVLLVDLDLNTPMQR